MGSRDRDVQVECGEKGRRKEARGGFQGTFQLRGQRQLLGLVPGAGSLRGVLGRAWEMGFWLKPLLVEVGLLSFSDTIFPENFEQKKPSVSGTMFRNFHLLRRNLRNTPSQGHPEV